MAALRSRSVGDQLARIPHIRLGAVISLAVAAGLVAAVLIGRSGSDRVAPVAVRAKAVAPRTVSADQLRRIAASRNPLVYWAGPQASRVLELTETAEGRVYVRYLTPQTSVGDRRAAFVTVATYPLDKAYEAVKAAAKRPGRVGFTLPRGGVAVYDRTRPTNLYVAYPDAQEQIEVYAPSAAQARRLVQSGRIRPVNEGPTAVLRNPQALTPKQLHSLASSAGPIYWAGPRSGKVYEVTRTGEGRVYVRYLLRAADVGSPRPDSLTVATYPEKNAFGDIQAASRRAGAVTIQLARGGLAVYDQARPTSVYLAYPGAKEQVEVFDPSPSRARLLVKAGQIQPVA
jgi:hypothetical protein